MLGIFRKVTEKVARVVSAARTWGMAGMWSAIKRVPCELKVSCYLKYNAVRNAATVPKRGITVIAPISGAYSLSKAMRDFVVRLREADVPCQVFDTCGSNSGTAHRDYEHILTSRKDFNILKYSHVVEMLKSPLPRGLPLKRCRIAFWEGEAGILEVFPYLADSDVVIAMSDFNAAYFRREIPPPVRVVKIPYPLLPLPQGILPKLEARKRFGIGENEFVVFYNFDIRADYRKNSKGTLEAFARAFRHDTNCRLLLKVNGARHASDRMLRMQELALSLGIANHMTVVTDYLSQTEIYSLTNTCDVYLSLHRAEGFGLGIAEAMSLGKACIVTNYSAVTEFCKPDTSILIPYVKLPIESRGFWNRMENWVEPDIDNAVAALRRLRADEAQCARLGYAAQCHISRCFSLESFKQAVDELLDTPMGNMSSSSLDIKDVDA